MIPKRVMLSVLATTDASGIRVAEFRGAEHTVIPAIALVEGVLWPANSSHPELALAEEFGRFPEGWNGSPIVYDHPKVNGVHVAASSPDILENNAVGQLFNTVLEDGKLKTELWIDNALVANLSEEGQAQIELLKSGDSVVEVSTGLFMMSEMVEGDFDGEHYNAIWRNIVPDHLAILPPGVPGACSIDDGCGAPRLNTGTSDRTTEFVPSMRAATLNINAEDCDCTVVGDAEDPDTQKSLFESLMSLGGKFLNFVGSSEHLSDGDIRAALNGALAVVEDQYTFIVSVFSSNDKGTFVYEVGFGDGLFERTFKIKNNKITIGDDAVMVRPETKFVPVEVVTNEANSTTQENAMNKDELVTGLIANKATQFTDDDKDFLNGLTEDQLQKMAPVANEEVVVERTAAQLLSDAKEEEEEEEEIKPVTTEDYIADAPPEVQQILNSGLKMHRARKDALITALTANSRNQFSKEQLESKDVTELENIVALAGDISYAGNGPVVIAASNADDADAIPAAPAVFDLAPKNADAA